MRKFLIGAFGVVALATSAVAQQGQQVYACKVIDTEGNEQYICHVRQSYDPNEMSGPAGVGTQRFVKPGDPMDYTIYFENQTNATAAAIKIAVTLPKDANLDWSTLELGEVVFGDHTDAGFVDDKTARSIKYALADSGCEIRTAVTETDSDITWNLRIWDPNTTDHFPDDFNKGVLPPNDPETHCGEGHISFRVKVKDDAATGSKINASASIVFDDNPAITTDPAWWNTVGSQGATFAESEVVANEGESVEVRVNGGNAESASSVKVYLTYNTAAAADVDLAKGTVSDATERVPPEGGSPSLATAKGLKFPLTLSWAKGEIGEKVITIPVKTDKAVEDDEFFTLQLAEAEGMKLGEERVCTVTIRDMNDKALKASVSPYKPKKDETVATNSVTVTGMAGGFVAGTGEYTSGSKLTLTAEARPGWAFVGWKSAVDGDILSSKAKWQVVVTNDEEYVAVFEKIPYVRGLADPADGGKVSGSGYCAAGKKVTLKATASKNYTFVGWTTNNTARPESAPYPDGHFVATTPSLVIDRGAKPAANSKTSTTVTEIDGDVTYFAVFKSDPKVSVSVEATDENGASLTGKGAGKYVAGTITGAGKYAPGKKATLKAAANKGYVFAGWYDGGRGATALPDDGGHAGRVTLPDDVISQAASLSFEMPSNDVEYVAMFVTAEEDKGSIELEVNGEEMAAQPESAPYRTNIWAGVYLEWPVAAGALSETKVKVAGLPSGLKFTDKPVTSKIGNGKTAVTVTNVLANTIYGAPTAASKTKVDKNTGAVTVTPSAVKVTVTTAGKSTQTYQIDTVVDPLPAWAVGTFAGGVRGSGALAASSQAEGSGESAASPKGMVSLTIDAKGKVSGKALGEGLTYTLAAPYYSGFEEADGTSNFVADVTASWSYKEGAKTMKTNDVVQLVVQDNGIGGVAMGGPLFSSAAQPESAPYHLMSWQYNWKVEPWKTLGKKFDKMTMAYAVLADGSFSDDEEVLASALGADVTARVTLKFAASGAVTVAGEFVTGFDEKKQKYTTVKATGSATLVPVDDDHGEVFIYLTPKGLAPHARCIEVPWPQE